jgi:transcriptional regulator with XRE-family HTH domain
MDDFPSYIRKTRLQKNDESKDFSLRKFAVKVGLEPSYLSKIERGQEPPPSENKIKAIASELDLESDVLLAMAGKVSNDLLEIIMKRPKLFGKIIRELKEMPDNAILSVIREVRDGDW